MCALVLCKEPGSMKVLSSQYIFEVNYYHEQKKIYEFFRGNKPQCADHDSNSQSDTLCANDWDSKTVSTSTEPTKIAPRARRVIAQKVKKVISNKSYLTLATVHAHKSTIRRTLNNNGVLGMAARRNRALLKKNTAAYLQFANHEDKPEGCWNNVCGWMKPKLKFYF